MKPRAKKIWKATGACALILVGLAANARRISRTDSEVISAAAMEVAYTKGGEYLGEIVPGERRFALSDLGMGGLCHAARNWTPKIFGVPKAPNVFAWNMPLPDNSDEWDKAVRKIANERPKFEGFLSFSLPIYSLSGHRAYLYYTVQEGPLWGGGGFVTMQKQDGKWVKVKDEVTVQY